MQLKTTRKTSRAGGYKRRLDPPPDPVYGWPDVALNIVFDAPGDCFTFFAFGSQAGIPPDGLSGKIRLSSSDVFEAAQLCRETWSKTVVECREKPESDGPGEEFPEPFKEQASLADRPALLESLRIDLVTAGKRLFNQVFEQSDDPGLNKLITILNGPTRFNIRICSDSFYVPWALIYTDTTAVRAAESDPAKTPDPGFGGFWGIRHIIQHKPSFAPTESGNLETIDGKLPTVAYIDDNVIAENDLAKLEKDWQSLTTRLKLVIRRNRADFDTAFAADPLADRVAYFFCHGYGAEDKSGASTGIPRIVITPKTFEIYKQDIQLLRKKNAKFRPPPFIFINACQGGQISTKFYQTVAAAFLQLDAMGVIGPQIDIPARFAAAYAKRFMEQVVSGADEVASITIGMIVRELAEEFVRKHCNPLGLVYSLYYGADCQVGRRPGPKRLRPADDATTTR